MGEHVRIAMMLVALAALSCSGVRGSGTRAEETRQVPQFTAVAAHGGLRLLVEETPDATGDVELHVTGDNNLLPLMKSVVTGDELEIGADETLEPELPLEVTARVAALKSIELDGSIDARIQGLRGEMVKLALSGSGKAVLEGKVKNLELEVSGSGKVSAQKVEAETVTVKVAGSGEVALCATGKLKADIAGSGTIAYYCNPAEVVENVAGSGELVKK